MKHLWFYALLASVLLFCSLSAQAGGPPPWPQGFYGAIQKRGQPAPIGTVIEGRGDNVKIGIPANPITTTVVGQYGQPTLLAIQGWIEDGTPIFFYADGELCQVQNPGGPWGSAVLFKSGVISKINLRVRSKIFIPMLGR